VGVDLVDRLSKRGVWELRLARRDDEKPAYRDRIRAAERWEAEVLLSLHSDSRGLAEPWNPPGQSQSCYRSDDDPGFAVLWSDEGDPTLVARRQQLARAIARRMLEVGLLPTNGENYEGLYEADDDVPGVFLDRHLPRQRILMLRRPRVPSVIIETHHARDSRESMRWEEPGTRAAFASAVELALVDVLGEPSGRAETRQP
jgi:N-acetylmuramoyl-L-alanine amidase